MRTFDDPATWTEPGRAPPRRRRPGRRAVTARSRSPDQWELYDLDRRSDRGAQPGATTGARAEVLDQLQARLDEQRRQRGPRAQPAVALRRPQRRRPDRSGPRPPPAWSAGSSSGSACTPRTRTPAAFDLTGRRALVVATNHGTLDIGKPTGVFASELTVPYYAFLDAGMDVDVASPLGGVIPVDPLSLKPVVRTEADDRFLADDDLRAKVTDSLADRRRSTSAAYDLVYLAGGWGAAFDFGFSEPLAAAITEANAAGKVIGGICHGPLGLAQRHQAATVGRWSRAGGSPRSPTRRCSSSASSRRRTTPRPSCGPRGRCSSRPPGSATCWPTTGWSTATS